MEYILLALFFFINVCSTLFVLFRKNEKLLPAKIQLTYISSIITIISALIYSLFSYENSFWPEFVKVLSILSVIAIVVMIFGVFFKEASITQVVPANIKERNNSSIFFTLFGLAIASRLIIYFLGYIYAIQTLDTKTGFFESFDSMWNKWDSIHYLNLAKNGYSVSGENAKLIVFYPFYPLLVRIAAVILKNHLLSGVVVSNLCLGVGCYYLYKLVKIDFDEETALRSVKYMLIYPFSFFFGIAYTESTFVALSIMALYYMRKNKWFLAGICGFFAALTKNQGIILIIPAVMEYVISNKVFDELRKKNFKNVLRNFFAKGIYMVMIPLGTLVYFMINEILFGSWNEFLVYQKKYFRNSFGNVFENIKRITQSALSPEDAFRLTYWIPFVLSFLLVMVLIFYSIGRLRISYSAYMLVFLLISFSPSWLLSGARYILSLVPIYISLSVLAKRREVDMILTFASTLLLGFYTLAFLMGRVL